MNQQTLSGYTPSDSGPLRPESYEKLHAILACPACRGRIALQPRAQVLECLGCLRQYPIVRGVPVMLVDYSGSLATLDGTAPQSGVRWKQSRVLGALLRWFLNPPGGLINVAARENYRQIRRMLAGTLNPRLLYVGGGAGLGVGSECLGPELLRSVINSDMFLFSTVDLVADGHRLPFAEESFDGVVIQSVLQHTANPQAVVNEISRVLRSGGIVYSEIPFLQRYYPGGDYQRFTREGLEVLFHRFEPVRTGMSNGPASSFGHIGAYFLAALLSFRSEALYKLMLTVFRWLFSPVRYLDHLLKDHAHAPEIAGGFYYLARKRPVAGGL